MAENQNASAHTRDDFDPQSPQYQLHTEYPPNKANTWKVKTQDDGWVLIHNCLRKEMQRLHNLLLTLIDRSQSSTLQYWEVDALKYILHIHFENVHGHHTNEDEILTPVLKERFAYPPKMEDDHSVIVNNIHLLEKIVHGFKKEDGTEGLRTILSAFETYEKSALPHFVEEEQVGLLLLRAYFTPKEYRKVVAKILVRTKKTHPYILGLMIDSLGQDYIRNTMMKNEGVPFFVWNLVFKREWKKFQQQVLLYYEALEKNAPPTMKEQTRIQLVIQRM